MRFHLRFCFFLPLLLAAGSAIAADGDWGDLTIRFTYDGEAPKPAPIAAGAAGAGCGAPLVDQSLLVDPKTKGVANVVVWLLSKESDKVPVHADYEKSAKDEVEMANKACQFLPRIALMRTSQTLVQANADAFGHNMKIDPFNNAPSNVIIPAMGKSSRTFTAAESAPTKVECGIHPWMGGYLLIRDDPYAAVSNASGQLTIPKLPAGKWRFKIWHERSGYVKAATLAGKPEEWKLGVLEATVNAGKNDLGEAQLKPALFAKR